ncbi:Sensor protein lytS [Fibrisoma limi BUZ 3]|uniref:Sensor protein lytS n=1 Tax=Fibrisoma limi BUZ 3 TaxID=1185876 RepID=I2GDV1_9BACT|nr:Sensor protein lytS [Fibrisoma limi BUZ 3]
MLGVSLISNRYFKQPFSGETVLRLLITVSSITLIWHANRFIVFFFRQKFTTRAQLIQRILASFLTGTLVTAILNWATTAARRLLVDDLPTQSASMRASLTINHIEIRLSLFQLDLLQALMNFTLFFILYETLFLINESNLYRKRLRKVEKEKEDLRVANLNSQLNALKQQVNPHFLFNSLNTLGVLIDDDPRQASLFLDELSSVYRYLLRSNDDNLTSLDKELEFIRSYYHLLKTRHGRGLNLTVQIGESYGQYQIPPLTLQLLVENAVKHNIVLPDRPLNIEIATDSAGFLTVRNNLQRKSVRVASNGVGLSNILTQYRVMGQPTPTILDNGREFSVTLPLIRELTSVALNDSATPV